MKNRYRFNVLSNFKTDGKCYEEKCPPKINEVGHQKRLFERILFLRTVEKTVKNGSYAPLFLFLNIARGYG